MTIPNPLPAPLGEVKTLLSQRVGIPHQLWPAKREVCPLNRAAPQQKPHIRCLPVIEGQPDLRRCFSLPVDYQGNLGDLATYVSFREEMTPSLGAAVLAQNGLLKDKW